MNGLHQRDPHRGQPLLTSGESISSARVQVVLLHGRGAGAADILGLAEHLGSDGIAYQAPHAAAATWYPQSFLAPMQYNEPGLSSALGVIDGVLQAGQQSGIAPQRQVLLGFSQGACLALEYAARHPRLFGGVIALSGGLITPPEGDHGLAGSLGGTPVFLGSSDPDPHIPWTRVEASARLFETMDADVTLRRYPDMGHTICPDELDAARRMIEMAGM